MAVEYQQNALVEEWKSFGNWKTFDLPRQYGWVQKGLRSLLGVDDYG